MGVVPFDLKGEGRLTSLVLAGADTHIHDARAQRHGEGHDQHVAQQQHAEGPNQTDPWARRRRGLEHTHHARQRYGKSTTPSVPEPAANAPRNAKLCQVSATNTPCIKSLPKEVETKTTGSTSGNPSTAVMPNPAPARAAIKAIKVSVAPRASAVRAIPARNPQSRGPVQRAPAHEQPHQGGQQAGQPRQHGGIVQRSCHQVVHGVHDGFQVGQHFWTVFLQRPADSVERGEQQHDPSQRVPRGRVRTAAHNLVCRVGCGDGEQRKPHQSVLGATLGTPQVGEQVPGLTHGTQTMERGLATLAKRRPMLRASSMARCWVPSKESPSISMAFLRPI